MPVLGSKPLLGQKRCNLSHHVPDEHCFQPKAGKCWEGNTPSTSLFKGKVPGKLLKPRTRTSALELCLSLPFTLRNTNCYWNTTSSTELRASSYHSWLIFGAGITPSRLTRLSALTLLPDLCLETFNCEEGACSARRKLPKSLPAHQSFPPAELQVKDAQRPALRTKNQPATA